MLARLRSVVVVSDAPPAALSFPLRGKRYGRKGRLGIRLVHSASEFRQAPMFRASFHSVVTLCMSYHALPDTGAPNLRLVTVEHLPSIEGADRICRSAPFCGEIIFICSVLICKIIRHYDTTILQYRKKRLRIRAISGILRPAETDSGCAARRKLFVPSFSGHPF